MCRKIRVIATCSYWPPYPAQFRHPLPSSFPPLFSLFPHNVGFRLTQDKRQGHDRSKTAWRPDSAPSKQLTSIKTQFDSCGRRWWILQYDVEALHGRLSWTESRSIHRAYVVDSIYCLHFFPSHLGESHPSIHQVIVLFGGAGKGPLCTETDHPVVSQNVLVRPFIPHLLPRIHGTL